MYGRQLVLNIGGRVGGGTEGGRRPSASRRFGDITVAPVHPV